jgi:hypothetical protein
MATYEDLIRQKIGLPLQKAAYNAGDVLQAKLAALGQLGNAAAPAATALPSPTPMAAPDIAAQQKNEAALRQQAASADALQKLRDQRDADFDPNSYTNYPTTPKTPNADEGYAHGGKVADSNPLRADMNDPGNKTKDKATAELEASRDPMGFIQKNKNPSIGGLRGVAFARGGLIPKRGK